MQLNMAGVKEITPGFAQEAFGNLYLIANQRRSRIKFTHASTKIKPILLAGVKSALR